MNTPDFPNGFESWQKTHFEVVEVLCYMRSLDDKRKPAIFAETMDMTASEELSGLALNLTNKYEHQAQYRHSDKSLFDEIEDFVWDEVKKL